jgi:hypothetical protein
MGGVHPAPKVPFFTGCRMGTWNNGGGSVSAGGKTQKSERTASNGGSHPDYRIRWSYKPHKNGHSEPIAVNIEPLDCNIVGARHHFRQSDEDR